MKIGNRNAGFALIVLDKELCREVCLARIHTAYTAIHTIPTIFHAATHTINNYAVFPHSNPDCDSQSKSCSALTHQLILRLTGQVMQHTHSTRGVATHTPIHATTRKANHATNRVADLCPTGPTRDLPKNHKPNVFTAYRYALFNRSSDRFVPACTDPL